MMTISSLTTSFGKKRSLPLFQLALVLITNEAKLWGIGGGTGTASTTVAVPKLDQVGLSHTKA